MSVLRSNGSIIGKVNSSTSLSSVGVWDTRTAFLDILGGNWSRYSNNYFGTGLDGDVTISSDTNLTSTTDGDVVVKNYKNLTVNSGYTLTTTNRCKGLLLYVAGDLTVNGTITMTARGASVDPVTAGVSSTGLRIIRYKSGSTQTLSGSDLAGCGSSAISAESNQIAISGNGKIYTISRTGASGGAAVTDPNPSSGVSGLQGGDGSTGQSGGGSSGGARYLSGPSGRGGNGTCFSGGPGGGATNNAVTTGVTSGSDTGGAGGNTSNTNACGSGAGNPAGTASAGSVTGNNGTGGLLIIIVKGNVTVGATGVISSNGVSGGDSQSGGGSSGGGNVLILRAGTYTNSGSVVANGGTATTLSARGGNGSVQVDQIDLY